MANGWLAVEIPVASMAQRIPPLHTMVQEAGGDPAAFEVIVGANIPVTTLPLGADHWIFTGALEQIKDDIERVRALGVNELFCTVMTDADTVAPHLASIERMWRLATE